MSDLPDEVRDAQFTYVSSSVRQLDPSATDAAIRRYLAEVETMAVALRSLDVPGETHVGPFTPAWPNGDSA